MKNIEKTINETNESNNILEKNTSDKEKIDEISKEQLSIETQNLLVNKLIKKQFPKTFTEQQEKQQEIFIKNLGSNVEFIKRLEGTPYNFTSNGFSCINEEGENENKIISNVFVVPLKKYNLKSENETECDIEMKAFLSPEGEELPSIKVPIKQIDSGNWFTNSSWGLKVIFELPIQKGKQIKCIKELGKFMEEETIYQFTGFTEIDGRTVYLHVGGAVGIDKDVKVDLGDENLNRLKLTDKKFDLKDSLNITFQCLDVAPKKTTVPILSLVFMAPLTSTFEEMGKTVGFLPWIIGPQQCHKTSLALAFASHFGNFNKNQAPMSFLDSIPTVIEKAAKAKDCLIVCDDYFPSANKQEVANMNKVSETLITSCADKMSGSRSKSNGKMRKTNRAKGQIIATRRNVSTFKSKSYVASFIY